MPFIHLNLSYIIIKIYDLWIIGLATYNQPSIIISEARKKSHRQMKFSDKTRMREWWSLELKRPQRSATPTPLFYKWINWGLKNLQNASSQMCYFNCTLHPSWREFFEHSFKFNYFWFHCVFIAVWRLSRGAVSGGSSLVVVVRPLIVVAFLLAEHRL